MPEEPQRLGRLVVIDLAAAFCGFSLAAGCAVGALITGVYPPLVLAVLALGVFAAIRERFRRVEPEDVAALPVDAKVDSVRRTAAETYLRLAPGFAGIVALPAAVLAWLWDPAVLLAGGGALAYLGGEYFGAALRVSRWERVDHFLLVQAWMRPFRRKRPVVYFIPQT